MLYDGRLFVRIRENIGLTVICVTRSGLIDRVVHNPMVTDSNPNPTT